MAIIYIKDLVVSGRHGVHPSEKEHAQRFSITVELTVDVSKAATSDNLDDTINYSVVRATIIDTVQNNSFNLIERLAQEITDRLLLASRAENVVVSIDKLDIFETGIPGVRINTTPSL
jgi:FolB domain-containing protein